MAQDPFLPGVLDVRDDTSALAFPWSRPESSFPRPSTLNPSAPLEDILKRAREFIGEKEPDEGPSAAVQLAQQRQGGGAPIRFLTGFTPNLDVQRPTPPTAVNPPAPPTSTLSQLGAPPTRPTAPPPIPVPPPPTGTPPPTPPTVPPPPSLQLPPPLPPLAQTVQPQPEPEPPIPFVGSPPPESGGFDPRVLLGGLTTLADLITRGRGFLNGITGPPDATDVTGTFGLTQQPPGPGVPPDVGGISLPPGLPPPTTSIPPVPFGYGTPPPVGPLGPNASAVDLQGPTSTPSGALINIPSPTGYQTIQDIPAGFNPYGAGIEPTVFDTFKQLYGDYAPYLAAAGGALNVGQIAAGPGSVGDKAALAANAAGWAAANAAGFGVPGIADKIIQLFGGPSEAQFFADIFGIGPSKSWLTFPGKVAASGRFFDEELGSLSERVASAKSPAELQNFIDQYKSNIAHGVDWAGQPAPGRYSGVGGYGARSGPYDIPELPASFGNVHGVNIPAPLPQLDPNVLRGRVSQGIQSRLGGFSAPSPQPAPQPSLRPTPPPTSVPIDQGVLPPNAPPLPFAGPVLPPSGAPTPPAGGIPLPASFYTAQGWQMNPQNGVWTDPRGGRFGWNTQTGQMQFFGWAPGSVFGALPGAQTSPF